MNTITLEVPEEKAEELVEMMEEEVDKYENVLNSFRSNNLTDSKAYVKLEKEKEEVEGGIEVIEEQIDEQTEEDNEGLAELFG
jgi:hypothetical protein